MNDSTKTHSTGGTQLPESVSKALNTLLASGRAWYQFQEHAHELHRLTDDQRKNAERDLSEPAATRVWLDTAESAETAGALTPSHCFLLRVSTLERVHERRQREGLYDAELAGIATRMEAIRQREGLNPDEYWAIGKGPEDWQKLENQYSQILDATFEKVLREYDFDDIADLYRDDRESYDSRREQGRRFVVDDIPELEKMSALEKQFEAEARICAEGGAYHAASIMIGSAIETALLFACLNRSDDALNARGRLPDAERPGRANPKRWTLRELAIVADEAGWLPDFEVEDHMLRSRQLLDMMRNLRNLVHPGDHLAGKRISDIKSAYTSARAAYILLKWHLADLSP